MSFYPFLGWSEEISRFFAAQVQSGDKSGENGQRVSGHGRAGRKASECVLTLIDAEALMGAGLQGRGVDTGDA
jgi:hypothetical protein